MNEPPLPESYVSPCRAYDLNRIEFFDQPVHEQLVNGEPFLEDGNVTALCFDAALPLAEQVIGLFTRLEIRLSAPKCRLRV
ncbi:hypothetical protein ACFIOY_29035 [Bradyrhizobium sp. TZ2]